MPVPLIELFLCDLFALLTASRFIKEAKLSLIVLINFVDGDVVDSFT
jgi:hypothetical protein